MPIAQTDIHYRLSGGSGNTNIAASLGGAKSNTQVPAGGVFDDVQPSEASAGDIEYRCVYVHNAHATLTMQGTVFWIQTNTPSASTVVHIAAGGEGLNGTAESVANENTAPVGESFVLAPDQANGIVLGDIPPGQHYPVWIRRTVTAGAGSAADSFTLRVSCNSAP